MPSSISSTGHEDGLGRRSLSFDRETGAMLEHLVVRPELAVFERLIRERIDQLTAFEDERFARPSSITRNTDTSELTVVSAFVPGHRISDLLETSHEACVVPGVDVALGYLLDALPALAALHGTAGFAHGLIDPARTVLTIAGRVVFLDVPYGAAVQRLGLSRKRLWATFGIAAPDTAVHALDATLDVSQTALSALMLVLGRKLQEDEYPEAIPSLLMEVVDVAQIRGSTGFAGGLQRILQRSLPLPGRRAYTTADEMVVDVRQLVRREIGVEVCRRALREFVEQMNAAIAADAVADDESDQEIAAEEDDLTASVLEEGGDDRDDRTEPATSESESHSDPLEFEIRLEGEDHEHHYDLSGLHFGDGLSGSHTAPEPSDRSEHVADPAPIERSRHVDEPAVEEAAATTDYAADHLPERQTQEAESSALDSASEVGEPEPAWIPEERSPANSIDVAAEPQRIESFGIEEPAEAARAESANLEPEPLADAHSETDNVDPEPLEEPIPDGVATDPAAAEAASQLESESEAKADEIDRSGKHSRRKRHQQKSARARKDKLRSTAVSQPTVSQPAAAPPAAVAKPQPSKSGWLVPPERAAAFEQHTPPPAPPAPMIAPPPPAPSFAQPSFAPSPVAAYTPTTPVAPQPVHPAPLPMPVHPSSRHANVPPGRPVPTVAPVVSSPVVKLKAEPPSGYEPQRPRRTPPGAALEPVTTLPSAMRGPMFETEEPRGFPWKLAIAALMLIAVGVVAGRYYLATHAAKDPVAETTASPVPITPDPEPAPAAALSKTSGQIVVQSQPAGAKVLLDGKSAGETPVTLNGVPPGRHLVTLISTSGSVKQTVRVAAGKSVSVDLPIFAGWLAVGAPVVLDVAEGGKSIGSTEQNRLMLAPGHHSLSLSNSDLGYTAVQEVDINAGEVTSITITPAGPVNFNAVPWAEVWMDGHKIGETPIANMMIPLGVHEFLFKNSQFPDRKVTATVRADKPTAVSVDFSKPAER